MQLRNPALALIGGGLAIGLGLFLATPTTPLPGPEPAWKRQGGNSEAYYSAQTFAAGPGPYGAATTYADHAAMAPQRLAAASYDTPFQRGLNEPNQVAEDPGYVAPDPLEDDFPAATPEPDQPPVVQVAAAQAPVIVLDDERNVADGAPGAEQ